MKRALPPVAGLPMLVFVTALLLQFLATSYLLDLSAEHQRSEMQKVQLHISQNLASQISRAFLANDDLTALTTLGDARANFPQLIQAMVFDNTGKILLHTDSGMMGKKTSAPAGPRLTSPETRIRHAQGRVLTSIVLALPFQDDGYFRADFDSARLAQSRQEVLVRAIILNLLVSLGLSLLLWLLLRRYVLLDPAARSAAASPPGAQADTHQFQRNVSLLLAEMPHAAVILDRDHRVLAVNTLAQQLLNCRPEELVGLHLMDSPLPAALTGFYQAALKSPAQPAQAKLSLSARAPAISVRAVFVPASADWEIALVTLQ